ncbi:MAG: type II toxin-antitoxin system HicB family antitoxin, partial [Bacteroidales bacterium]|nr:type II toxin-antitoxin system HicB family antitoxin [Bacteroidales bacterium]
MEYTIIVEKDKKSGWFVGQCEQIPGALSQGETIDDLMENMKDAIELFLED